MFRMEVPGFTHDEKVMKDQHRRLVVTESPLTEFLQHVGMSTAAGFDKLQKTHPNALPSHYKHLS